MQSEDDTCSVNGWASVFTHADACGRKKTIGRKGAYIMYDRYRCFNASSTYRLSMHTYSLLPDNSSTNQFAVSQLAVCRGFLRKSHLQRLSYPDFASHILHECIYAQIDHCPSTDLDWSSSHPACGLFKSF